MKIARGGVRSDPPQRPTRVAAHLDSAPMAVAPPKAEAVAQATETPPKGPGEEAKEQGNAHFKAKEYLKAAAN